MAKVLRFLSSRCLDWVFPRYCIACEDRCTALSPLRYLCGRCAPALNPIDPPFCPRCAYPHFGSLVGPRECPRCLKLQPAFESARSLFLLEGPARDLVHELKYHRGFFLQPDFTELFRSCYGLGEYLGDSILVPVPLHPQKLRTRGFNQSQLLCETIQRAHSGTRVQDVLIRTRHTSSQTRLSIEGRRRNVKNAFALSPKITINTQQKYTLVDDVFTTGATLNACAQTLKKAGAQSIQVLTFGHG